MNSLIRAGAAQAKAAVKVVQEGSSWTQQAQTYAKAAAKLQPSATGSDVFSIVALRDGLSALIKFDVKATEPFAVQRRALGKLRAELSAPHATGGVAMEDFTMLRLKNAFVDYVDRRIAIVNKLEPKKAGQGEMATELGKLNRSQLANMPAFPGFSATNLGVQSLAREWKAYLEATLPILG